MERTRDLVVTTARSGSTAEVSCRGELDLGTLSQFTGALEPAFSAAPQRLLLDLRELDFVDSSGLQAIWEVTQRCTGLSIPVRVLPSANVRRLFDLVQLELPGA